MSTLYELATEKGVVTLTFIERTEEDKEVRDRTVGSIRMTAKKAKELGEHLIELADGL